MVAADSLEEPRLVGPERGDRVAEERRRDDVPFADRHEPQAGLVGDAPTAADDEHLAARGSAPAREPAGADAHPAPEVVDGAEPEERAAELALAVERGRRRRAARHAAENAAHVAVQGGVRRSLPAHAEPRHMDRAGVGRDRAQLLADVPVLRGNGTRVDDRQHRCRRRDAGADEQRALAPAEQAHSGQPEGKTKPPKPGHPDQMQAK